VHICGHAHLGPGRRRKAGVLRQQQGRCTLAICISGQPPPYSTRASAVAALSTHSASCSDRSASSSTCEPAQKINRRE